MALQKIFADLSVHDASITNVLIKDNEVQGGKLASKSVALDRVSDAFISNLLDTQLRAIYPQLGSAAMALSQNMNVEPYMPAAKSEEAPSYDSATRVWSNLGAVVRSVGYMADTENLVVVRKANNDPVVDANGNEIFGRLEKTVQTMPMPMTSYRVHFVIKPGTVDEADATIPVGSMAFLYIKQWVAGGSDLLRDPGRVIIANPKAVDITESNNIDAVRKALGVSLDGSGSNPLSFTGTNHLNMITDVKAALVALDAALQSGSGNIQAELDATQTGAGLNASGAYIVEGAANYINSAVSLADADSKLDAALKQVADDLAQEIIDRAADVNAEQLRAETAEAGLQAEIDAEELARAAADTALQGEIDAEELARAAADTALQGEIDAEEVARAAADAAIQAELDAVEAAAGFQADGTLAAFTGANYVAASGTLRAAIVALDTQLKSEYDARSASDTALSNELDATQAGAGLGSGGAYVADATTNYLGSAVSLMDADKVLDARVKQIADNLGVVATAGLTFTGTNYLNAKTDVKAALVELDVQIKSVVDDLAQEIIDRAADVDAEQLRAETAEAGLQAEIDAEELARAAADTVLQGNIDAEETARIAADNALDARLDTIEAVQWRVRRFVATGSEEAVAKDAGHPAIPSADALFVTIDGMSQWPAAAGGVWTLQAAGAGVDLNFALRAGQTVELKYQA